MRTSEELSAIVYNSMPFGYLLSLDANKFTLFSFSPFVSKTIPMYVMLIKLDMDIKPCHLGIVLNSNASADT